MVKRGEKFPEEEVTHGEESPGLVEDDEVLERRLPPTYRKMSSDALRQDAFPRRALQWTDVRGGASVVRRRHAGGAYFGQRGKREMIIATVGDIRNLTDSDGNRIWSVVDRPIPENPAHAEIQREPLGKKPGRSERDEFLEVWSTAGAFSEDQCETDFLDEH